MSRQSDSSPRQGVVAVVLRGERFLVIRRSQQVRAPGMICFPGGAIDPGESEPAAVRREMREELELDCQPVRLLWRSTTAWQVDLAWWLTAIDDAAEPVANALEVAWFGWLAAGELRQIAELLPSNLAFRDAWESGIIKR